MFGLNISDDSIVLAIAAIVAALITAISGIIIYKLSERKKVVEEKNKLLQERILESQKNNPYTTIPSEKIFINSLDYSTIKEIKILAHTGKILVDLLRIALDTSNYQVKSPIKIKILLKDPFSEHPDRRDKIMRTYESFKSFDKGRDDLSVEIRFYSSIQTFRGIFVTHDADKRDCFFSAYNWIDWHDNLTDYSFLTTKAVNKGFVWTGENEKEPDFLKVAENWFNYLWGPGIIHTIAFDFDDTLFATYSDHIEAWERAIYTIYESNPEVLALFEPKLKDLLKTKSSITQYCINNFLIHNNADEIACFIFQNNLNYKNYMSILNEFRYEHRMSKVISDDSTIMERNINQRLIPNISENMKTLRNMKYTLYVASLTDEILIEKVLRKSKVEKLITGILGRSDYSVRKNKEISAKEYLLLKLCSLSGIPPYRLLYIGDHRNDFIASKHLGSSFIEARLIETTSHIVNIENLDYSYFTKYNQLPSQVNEAETRISDKLTSELDELSEMIHNKKVNKDKLW